MVIWYFYRLYSIKSYYKIATMKAVMEVFRKLKTVLLGIYLDKTVIQNDTQTLYS